MNQLQKTGPFLSSIKEIALIRRFYVAFPIRDAARHELSWTHHRVLRRNTPCEQKTNSFLPVNTLKKHLIVFHTLL